MKIAEICADEQGLTTLGSVSKVLRTYLAIVVPFHESAKPNWDLSGYFFENGKGVREGIRK
jgi:hypothetical protein